MISIYRKQDCCGCNACGDVCPKGAITFATDHEGFLYPAVNQEKCIHCGLCDEVCPQIHADRLKASVAGRTPKCFAAVTKSLPDRFDSTSGGMYTTLAEYILAQDGYIGGAIWGESFGIYQIVSDKKEDLPRLRSSKYAQSDARGFYSAVKGAVKTGKPVMVCGTPCQMMAVKLFVGNADNLILVDFICRGINSPLVLKKYIEHHEDISGKKIIAIKQKCKELGWRSLSTKLTFEDGDIKYDKGCESLFMRLYFPPYTVLSRPSCYECKFKGVSRVTDLTIADCWGVVDKLNKWTFDMNLGTSSVMCHTPKGRKLFDAVAPMVIRQDISVESIVAGSTTICESLEKEGVDRTEFYSVLSKSGLRAALVGVKAREKRKPTSFAIVKRMVRGCIRLSKYVFSHPLVFCQDVRINGFVRTILLRPRLRPIGNVYWQQDGDAKLIVDGASEFGNSLFRGTRLESRALLTPGSRLILHGCKFGYGCNLQIFNGGTIEIGSGFYCNIGATIICSGRIKIGRDVICGRNVTIREYHGNHFINSPGYQCAKPIVIGDHVWICEHSTIMPGVKVGSGSVVASHSLVTKDVPPNTLVAGTPARVIRTGVQWKA